MLRQEVYAATLAFMPKGKTPDTVAPDEAIDAFKSTVGIRQQMGGAMHWNMMNAEVHMWYDICRHIGVDDEIMQELHKDLQ